MNKKIIVASLNDIANELDSAKLFKESNLILGVMQKLAMPSGRNEMIIQEITETLNNFNGYTNKLDEEMNLFNRVLRAMQDSLEDRRSDPEEIFRYKRKLQTVFEDVKNLSVRLNKDAQELSRLSVLFNNSMQNAQQEQNTNTSNETAKTMTSDELDENMNENSETKRPSQRRPFSN